MSRKFVRVALVILGMASAMTIGSAAQDAKSGGSEASNQQAYAPSYRLSYTLTESEGARKVGVQRFAMVLTPGNNGRIVVGSKVPVVTGTSNGAASLANTQFTYIDVGVHIDARLELYPNGLKLSTKIEQSGVSEAKSDSMPPIVENIHEPVIRQATLEMTALTQLGKTIMLGSLDTPGSTRHVDVEVQVELVR